MSHARAGRVALLQRYLQTVILCVCCRSAIGAPTLFIRAAAGTVSTSEPASSAEPTKKANKSNAGDSPKSKSSKTDGPDATDVEWYKNKAEARVGGLPAWMWVATATVAVTAIFAAMWLWRRHKQKAAKKAEDEAKEAEEKRLQEAEKAAGITFDDPDADAPEEDLADDMTQGESKPPYQGQFLGVPDVPYRP